MATINVAQVVAEFGARYTNQGQTAKDIKKQLFEQSITGSFFQNRPFDQDFYRSVFADVDEVVQAFGIPFTPKGSLTFKPWETRLGEFKIDDQMIPDKFRYSWLGFLANIPEPDRTKWPIILWYIRQLLIPASDRDMEEKIAYRGWQKTGYAGVPTVDGATFVRELTSEDTPNMANASMDGILVQIAKMVDQSRANVIATGALSTDPVTFMGQVEDFVLSIPRAHRSRIDYVFMSEDLVNRYKDGVREAYNKYYKDDGDLDAIKNSMVKVKTLPSMDGSQKIWATMPMNRIMPIHVDNTGRFDVQKSDRAVKLLTDWKKLLTFDVPEFVYTNDQENAITAGMITTYYTES